MPSEEPSPSNVLIVPAGKWAYHAWHEYGAYICQADRSFRPNVDRIGYYANNMIYREFPLIQDRRDHVLETRDAVQALLTSGNPADLRFAAVMGLLILDRGEGTESQIFLLSLPNTPDTLVIDEPIRNVREGRGSAWAQSHRYVPQAAIEGQPRTTAELSALLK